MATTKTNLVGKRIGRLVVLNEAFGHKHVGKHRKWHVVCDCGNERDVYQDRLVSETTLSCGCLQKDVHVARITTHGKSNTPIHSVWQAMLARCTNSNNPAWEHYGGRGITVCERWKEFENFYSDMGDHPFVGAELDRIDNNGNYEPSNCRWATRSEQTSNTRRNVMLTIDGVTNTVMWWSKQVGISYRTLSNRVHSGVTGQMLLAPTHRGVPHGGI